MAGVLVYHQMTKFPLVAESIQPQQVEANLVSSIRIGITMTMIGNPTKHGLYELALVIKASRATEHITNRASSHLETVSWPQLNKSPDWLHL